MSLPMIAELQNAYTQAVERVGASTVNVSMTSGPYGQPFGRPWPRRGIGSGVILDGQGHILTTYHVVDGADKVIVTFSDGPGLSGTVVAGDAGTHVPICEGYGPGFAPPAFPH